MDDVPSAPDQLEDFVRSMLLEKHLPGMTEELLPGLIEETTGQLREIIDMAVIDALPPEKQEELNGVLEDPDTTPETVSEFITNSGVDASKVTTETILRFHDLYLQDPEAGL